MLTKDDENPFAEWESIGRGLLHPEVRGKARAIAVVTGLALELVEHAMKQPGFFWMHSRERSGIGFQGRGAEWIKSPRDRIINPREAWELLGADGVIPVSWVDDPSRRFFNGFMGVAPPTIDAAVTLASDPEGVVIAEQLSREIASRLAYWNTRPGIRALWVVGSHAEVPTPNASDVLGGAAVSAAAALVRGVTIEQPPRATSAKKKTKKNDTSDAAQQRQLDSLLAAAKTAVEAAVIRGAFSAGFSDRRVLLKFAELCTVAAKWRAATATGQFFVVSAAGENKSIPASELPSPFDPLMELWSRGYALLDVSKQSARLFALGVEEQPAPRWVYSF